MLSTGRDEAMNVRGVLFLVLDPYPECGLSGCTYLSDKDALEIRFFLTSVGYRDSRRSYN